MFALQMAEDWASLGHRSVLVVRQDSELFQRASANPNLVVYGLPKAGYFSPKVILKLKGLIKQFAPQALVIHWMKDLWIVVPALLGHSRIRLVGFGHMIVRIDKKDFLHRWLYGRLDKLIALTPFQLKGFKDHLPVRDQQLVVAPHGADPDSYSSALRSEQVRSREFGLRQGELAIGVIGRLDPQKGQKEFVEAAVLLAREFAHVRFFLVGAETKGEEGFRQLLELLVCENQMQDRIHFLGYRQNIPLLTANFDILVVPSYEETFGLVVLEAMSCGVAVVGTRAGGIPYIIDEGKTGLLIAPRDSNGLAESLRILVTDGSLRSRLGRQAREAVLSKFNKGVTSAQQRAIVIEQ